MNKVLVTGLGLGYDFGICGACNLDFSWIINNPSTLVWADKIVITQSAWEHQINKNIDKFDKAVNLILEIASKNNLIELINPTKIMSSDIGDKIYEDVKKDMIKLEHTFPELIKKGDIEKVPNELMINGKSFCGPKVASIYASMKLSEKIQANCLLSRYDYEYLKFKFGLADEFSHYNTRKVMDEVFTLYLPNELVLHNYAFTSEKTCISCEKNNMCKENYLSEIEKSITQIVKWKSYDELSRAKEELEKIIEIKQLYGSEINPQEIKKEYFEKQNKINNNINKIFPKIKRWTNLTTVIATPISILSAAMANAPMTIAATGTLGAVKIIDEAIKYYENSNNWVGFINNINSK